MKLSVTLLIAMMATSVKSQYINQIIDEEKEGVFYSTSLLTDSTLYYQTQQNTDINLWSMDLTTKKKEKLIGSLYDVEDDEDTQAIDYIKPYRGAVYFSHTNERYDRYLWLTDGSKTGTQRVNNTELNSGGKFGVFNDELFAENIGMYLIQLNNNEFVPHDVKFPSLDHICVFSADDFIVQSRNAAADIFTLNRVTGSTVTSVYSYPSSYDDNAEFETYNDRCLFSHTADGVRKVFSVSKVGETKFISVPESTSTIEQLINHQGRVYISARNNDSATYSIHRLSEDLSTIDATVEALEIFSLLSISSDNHLLSAVVKDNNSDRRLTHAFFDQELNVVNSFFRFYDNLNHSKYSSFSGVITVFNDYREDAIIQTINDKNMVSLLSIKDHYISEVISHPDSEDIYLALFDRNIGKGNIYSLNEQPPLNNSINGTWHEYDIPNQGLVIQKGRRNDGSEYVFTTFYTFDQGEPLWLAGVSDLTLDEKKLDISLYQYDGIQLFEYDATPNREIFGQLSLEFEDCDTIKVSITGEEYNQTLPLYRIDDTSYMHLCADIKPLSLNNYNNKSNFNGVLQ